MKKFTIFSLLLMGIIHVAVFASAEKPGKPEYNTAIECFKAAQKISYSEASAEDFPTIWRTKFDLLKRAIELDPRFTEAYVPYVKTYFEAPLAHEFQHADELDDLTALLKKELQYNPPNGDEFYLQLVKLEDKRWGYTKDSLIRSIDYLKQALNKYPNSSLRNNLILSIYSNYEHLGKAEDGIQYLKMIVESNGSDQTDKHALESLIHYYTQVNDYSNLLKYSDLYIDKFGFNSDWSSYAIYCKALSCNKLKLHDKLIEISRSYFSEENKIYRDAQTDKKIYLFLSEAYESKGNVELTTKYKKLSR